MADCPTNDISAKLAAALSAEEFPEDSAATEEHLSTFGRCREELHALRLIDGFLREHRASLTAAVPGCPAIDALVDFAEGREDNAEIDEHLTHCPDCAEYIQLVRDLALHELPQGPTRPTHAQQRIARDTVEGHYGTHRESRASRMAGFFDTLRASLSIPSLAVAAALLLAFLLPHSPTQSELIPLMSDVTWKTSIPGTFKSPFAPDECAAFRQKVALIILTPEEAVISDKEAQDLYERMDIAKRLGSSYDFLCPKDLRESMGKLQKIRDLTSLAYRIGKQTESEYVIFLEIAKREAHYSVKGTLFQNRGQKERPHIFHGGLTLDRVPSLITVIGSELLTEAEYS